MIRKYVRQEPLSYELELRWIRSAKIKIHEKWGWRKVCQLLREIPLIGDHDIHPYKDKEATIESRVIMADEVYPLSFYLLKGKLEIHQCLRRRFLAEVGIDVFDLKGGFEFSVDGGINRFIFGPPIVEVSEVDGGKPLLLDGLHRLFLARENKEKIRVIWLSNIPKRLPIICYPLAWKEIRQYDKVPTLEEMRRYRWRSFREFCRDNEFAKANLENWRYFLYRDVSQINSTWHRLSGDKH